MSFKKYFTKEQVLTLPNLLSLLRLLMIPALVWVYCGLNMYGVAAVIFIVSALTDVVDGFIARRFNMVSDLGKALDPVADKLTQLAMLFCLTTRYTYMIFPLCLLLVKETVTAATGLLSIHRSGAVRGAVWHGKLTTVLMFVKIMLHILWIDIPPVLSLTLVAVCSIMMGFSFFMYVCENIRVAKNAARRRGER